MTTSPTTNEDRVPLPMRPHTILGVCEALGEDFGISAYWLRLPLGAMVLWSIEYAMIAYAALGLVVLASRLLFPVKKATVAVAESKDAPVETATERADELRLAA